MQYASRRGRGSIDEEGVACGDDEVVARSAAALHANAAGSCECDGNTLTTGPCGAGTALTASGAACACTNPGYILRPCIGNFNWGGINGPTCNAHSQRMDVIFEVGG